MKKYLFLLLSSLSYLQNTYASIQSDILVDIGVDGSSGNAKNIDE